MTGKLSRLHDVLPSLAVELTDLLTSAGHSSLAEQVPSLRIFDRCRCDDWFCATFYTAPPPKGAWGSKHENVALDPEQGYLVLDVLDGKIVAVEALYRDDLRKPLWEHVP